ncbi:MAG: hypothetical protein COB04_16145 [Gammaproteobacteria bacterium]|nr:MAG: hypothetical protein COB04_16145 [Gammaproteobacteria bacterium]
MSTEFSEYLFGPKYDLDADTTEVSPGSVNPRDNVFCLAACSKKMAEMGTSVRDRATHEALFFFLPQSSIEYILDTCLGYKLRDFVNRIVDRQRIPRFYWLATQITDAVLIAISGSSMIHHFDGGVLPDFDIPTTARIGKPAYVKLLGEEVFYTRTLHILAADAQLREFPENKAKVSRTLKDCLARNANCNVVSHFVNRPWTRNFTKNRSFLHDSFGLPLKVDTANSRRHAKDVVDLTLGYTRNVARLASIRRFVSDFTGQFPRQKTTLRTLVRNVAEMVIDVWATDGLSTMDYFATPDIPQAARIGRSRSHLHFRGAGTYPHSAAIAEDFVFGYGDDMNFVKSDDQMDMILTFLNAGINRFGTDCFSFEYHFKDE